jgi:D-glycero-alpha-D-manno-heptose 1-phosphate guanylyltransferase
MINKTNKPIISTVPDLTFIDKSWSLFLDRDGVINDEVVGKYILNWDEFNFIEGVLHALKILNKKFNRIVIVSNQRGVGKSLMTEQDLHAIHNEMLKEVESSGGRIDKIYYCTATSDKHPDRKPNPGMALKAKNDFPDIDLTKSVMVGNKPGDMLFGRTAGMVTVFITSTNPDQPFPNPDIDFIFPSLHSFAQALES